MLLLDSSVYISTFLVGLSCNMWCSSTSGFLMGGWISTSEIDLKNGMKAVISFIAGKILVYTLLAILASLLGSYLKENYINFLGDKANMVFQVFIILVGIYLLYSVFRKSKCKICNGKSKDNFSISRTKSFWLGILYGITPCYPMSVMILNATSVGIFEATILSLVFGITSFFSPLLLIGIVSGKISQLIRNDIGNYIRYFQGAFAIMFIIIGISQI